MPSVAVSALRRTANRTRNITYGEVLPVSIHEDVIPRLNLRPDDVFFDIGSGTGKIPLQVALETPCALACGVEFVARRHELGTAALERLRSGAALDELRARGSDDAWCARLRDAANRTQLVCGDACRADLRDATVIFINNTVFQPDLMASIVEKLAGLRKLRKVCGGSC
jgi:precorrin-6B methylase 2